MAGDRPAATVPEYARGLTGARGEIAAPSAEARNLDRLAKSVHFDREPLSPRAIGKIERREPERTRDASDEPRESFRRQRPDFRSCVDIR